MFVVDSEAKRRPARVTGPRGNKARWRTDRFRALRRPPRKFPRRSRRQPALLFVLLPFPPSSAHACGAGRRHDWLAPPPDGLPRKASLPPSRVAGPIWHDEPGPGTRPGKHPQRHAWCPEHCGTLASPWLHAGRGGSRMLPRPMGLHRSRIARAIRGRSSCQAFPGGIAVRAACGRQRVVWRPSFYLRETRSSGYSFPSSGKLLQLSPFLRRPS